MKRTLLVLVPWMALVTTAAGQVRMADVLYTHFDDVPTRAFRVGDECFVGIEDVRRWGWDATIAGDTVQIRAEGQDLRVPMRTFTGRQTLPLRNVVTKLGGKSAWTLGTDTLEVFSEIREITAKNGRVFVDAPLGFRPRVMTLTNPGRIVFDFHGARVVDSTKQDLGIEARVHQYRPNQARLIYESETTPDFSQLAPSRTFEITIPKLASNDTGVPTEPNIPVAVEKEQPAQLPTLLSIEVGNETESRLDLRIPLQGNLKGMAQVQNTDVGILQIKLPGVFGALPEGHAILSDSVTQIQSEVVSDGTVLTLSLSRPMGAQVVTNKGVVSVSLLKPLVGDGHLAGKVIVVDPGHGGYDGGTKSSGVLEKDLNLKIGRLIAEALTQEGATVIMTRNTDVFIPLSKRAEIANQSKADLFISNHINSTGGAASQSGTITFHHQNREISRVLAACIQREIAKVNQLPNIGVWSDRKIYKTGFAVLRQSTMPGVLLELGFLNHPRDRARMVTDSFQRSVAKAVVQGIKVYLGDAKKND